MVTSTEYIFVKLQYYGLQVFNISVVASWNLLITVFD